MTRTRKTVDSFNVQGHYTHGWEDVSAYDTRADARQGLKEYRENERGTAFQLIKRRERIEQPA